MKFLKRIRSSLNSLLSPKPGKNGSSMAFVMIVGAVLVIWVLAIMPLMVAVGNNSLTLQGSYADYLGSRSAIEFCKGELEKMVESKPPYTFCVVKNVAQDGSYTYTAIPKMDSISLSTQYDNAINRDPDAVDNTIKDNVDTDDIPEENDLGKTVVAICAISQDEKEENVYNIIITTYNNGKKGLTYSTVYTIRGSLLINPESYKQTQALPLSDFVLVDGKLGANEIWKSNIRGLAFSEVTDLSQVVESLLPYDPTKLPGSGYADSGEYPAVFKTPVYPAGGGPNADVTEPTKPDYTGDGWIVPNPVSKDKNSKQNGDIYFKIVSKQYTYRENNRDKTGTKNTIRIYLKSDNTDITDKCDIYLNGEVFTAYKDKKNHGSNIPSTGIYQVSIDFDGYNKVLPADGLILGHIGDAVTSSTVKQTAPIKTDITISGSTVTVNSHASNTGVTYGYCAVENFPEIEWKNNSNDASFQIEDSSKAYYFFAYRNEYYQNGTYYAASDVTYMGCVYPLETTTQLQNGGDYLIVAKNNSGNYYAMGRYNNNITQQHIGTLPTLIASTPNYSNDYLWHVEGSNNTFTFRNKGNNKFLSLFGEFEGWWFLGSWNFSLSLDDGTNNASFTYNGKKLSRSIKSGRQTTSGYINFESGSFIAGDSGSEIYFIKIPVEAPAEPDLRLITVSSNFVSMNENSIVHGTALSDVITGTYDELKANGSDNTDNLSVGKYNVTAVVGGNALNLGMIEVTKAPLSGNLTIETTQADHNVTVTIKAMNFSNAGVRWIGYKATGSAEYAWFPADDNNSYTFTLPYGNYEFVARESGTLNYNPEQSIPVTVSLTVPDSGEEDNDTPSMMMGTSLYFMGRDNVTLSNAVPNNYSIDTEGNTIYLTADLLVLRHGIKGNGKVIVYPYTTGENEQNDTLLFAVNDIKNASGRVVFEALHFYKIPVNTDINRMSAEDAAALESKDLGSEDTEEIKQIQYWFRKGLYPEINLDIAYLDRDASGSKDKYYTDSDDRDTYRKPDNRQLANIISSETIGWTRDGTLSGYDATRYPQFAICAFVTGITKNAPDERGNTVAISYIANRILLAAEMTENNTTTKTLKVPTNIVFTTRYFSIHADSVVQTVPNSSFILKNLGEDENFFKWLSNALSITNYRSKTMQIDYERSTTISGNNNVQYISPQICRYSDGTDLFGGLQNQSLMATYTVNEIESMFTNPIYSIVKTVDRYVTIEPTAGSDSMTFGTATTAELDIYANYVYFSPTVKNITLYGHKWANTTKIMFNTQESGYTTEEYFGLFKNHSSDAYSGTIVYFGSDINLTEYKYAIFGEDEVETKTIASGFYYVPAELNGISIWSLVKPNTGDNAYKITTDQLKAYSVYIDPDTGALNKAYVDTGIFDNTAEGAGGFSGGNVG